jgi:hypothetical protein
LSNVVGGNIESALDDLAATLGASLALEDTEQRLLAHTDPGEVIDAVRLASILGRRATPEVRSWFEQWGILEATGPVRTPAGPTIGALARWCIPVRQSGRLLGYIWVLDDGHLPAEALAPAVAAAEEIAPDLSRRRRAEQADAELARDLVDPGGGAGDLRERFLHRGPVVVAALGTASTTPDPGAIREIAVATRRTAEELADGTTATAPFGDHVVAILPLRTADDLEPARRLVERARQLTGRQARGIGVVVGLSAGRSSVAAAPAAHLEARRALATIRAVTRTGPVARWDALGAYRLLAALGAEGATLVDPRVVLLAADDELAGTAGAFLDLAGDVAGAAAVLNVHRATLYHRLSRIQERTGLDLQRSGDDRLATHLGLRVLELHG